MPDYIRSYIPGGTYFFTVAANHRQPILTGEDARRFLHIAWKEVEKRHPFTTEAICLLPDHLHCIWTLPQGDANYSVRWKEIKRLFSIKYGNMDAKKGAKSSSREKRKETIFWQRRFWEHTIRDERDYHHHLDYVHFNPVKHGLVECVSDWEWSSFHRYVRMGYYDLNWGGGNQDFTSVDFGE